MPDLTMPDLQDPLPESNWMWRRIFVYVVTAVLLWFLWGAIDRLGGVAILYPRQGVPALLSLCRWIMAFNILMVTYYLLAPSAEQMTKMIHMAALLRSGVQFASRSVQDGDHKEVAATAAVPPQPAAPPISGGEAAEAMRPIRSERDKPTEILE